MKIEYYILCWGIILFEAFTFEFLGNRLFNITGFGIILALLFIPLIWYDLMEYKK